MMIQQLSSTQKKVDWHTREVNACFEALQSSQLGLSQAVAQERLRSDGPNELTETSQGGVWKILWEQLSSTMIVILIAAGLLSFFLKAGTGFPADAVAILSIVVLFVFLGTFQEFKAQKAIQALRNMATPQVRVFRSGILETMPSKALVRGDLISLEAGQTIPADCRLIAVQSLKVQEASLTGESEPTEKSTETLAPGITAIGDRKNMIHMGTAVTFGRAQALVTGTGDDTELGRISTLLQTVQKSKTPLQKKLNRFGNTLAIIAVLVAILVGGVGMWVEGKAFADVIVLAISIAVAVVPEGLPAVMTFTLALGAQKMLKRKALVRKLPAVETLGSVTTICSDKTGTLTQNLMTVTDLCSDPGQQTSGVSASGNGQLLTAFALCNDVENGVGDPTEKALVDAIEKMDPLKRDLKKIWGRHDEFPFDSVRKRMSTVHKTSGDTESEWHALLEANTYLSFTKGAFEQIFERCTSRMQNGKKVEITNQERLFFSELVQHLSSKGKRVLAFAARPLSEQQLKEPKDLWEQGMSFLGVCAMIDPPRWEARDAVLVCQKAGIRVVMITGDHPSTAKAIAQDLRICNESESPVTGDQLETWTRDELNQNVLGTRVFARVSPEQKLRIVEALQFTGQVVAMTGDGVNDAPALKKADIGVAMGSGTDVAKEAADIVLLDDNFATIVAAVEEGRIVYDNLKRFVMFSLSGNIAKVLLVALSPLLGMKTILTPIQILFSNLLTDGLLGLGMGLEKAEPNTMTRPPMPPDHSLFASGAGWHVAIVGPVVAAVILTFGCALWPKEQTQENFLIWGTTMFTMLAFTQLSRAFSSRSFTASAFSTGFKGNRFLMGMVLLALILQLISVFSKSLNPFFNTIALSSQNLALCFGVAVLLFVIMELIKFSSVRLKIIKM